MHRVPKGLVWLGALIVLSLVSACAGLGQLATSTATPAPTFTASPTSTPTRTPTPSPTPAPTSTPTPTPEPTPTPRGHLEVAVILHGPSRFLQVDRVLAENDVSSVPILAYSGESIPDLTSFDAVIVSGGEYPPSQFDKLPFLQEERDRVMEAMDRGVPILGICLGHQLLAHWLGGSVERSEQFEVGVGGGHKREWPSGPLAARGWATVPRFPVALGRGDRASSGRSQSGFFRPQPHSGLSISRPAGLGSAIQPPVHCLPCRVSAAGC